MVDIPVNSIEVEANHHNDDDNSTLSGDTEYETCCNNTIR